jgi:elongation factor Ts
MVRAFYFLEEKIMSTTTIQIKQLRKATAASFLDCVKALEVHSGDFDQALAQLRAARLLKGDQKADRETNEGLIIVKQAGNRVCAIEINCETDFVVLTQEFKTFAHRIADQILDDPALCDVDSVLAADFIDRPGQAISLAAKELAGKLGENITIGRVARYEARQAGIVEGYIHVGATEGYGPAEGRLGVLVELGVEDTAEVVDTSTLRELAHNLALQIASSSPMYLSKADIPADVLDKQRTILAAKLAAETKPDDIKAKIIEGLLDEFSRNICLLSQSYIRDESMSIEGLLQQKSEEIGIPVTVVQFDRLGLNV